MPARLIEIADAVLAQMNTAPDWPAPFTAERVYLASYTPTEKEALLVTVMVMGSDQSLITRGKRQRLLTVDIGIQKKVRPTDLAVVDALVLLAEKITDYWTADPDNSGPRVITGQPTAKIMQVQNDPVYSVDDMKNKQVFFSHVILAVLDVTNV